MKSEVLDVLFGARDSISEILIATIPSTPQELAAVRQLFARRDKLTGAINQVIEAAFKPVDISRDLDAIQEISTKLEHVARNINGVRDAIGIVDQVVTTTTSLIALAA